MVFTARLLARHIFRAGVTAVRARRCIKNSITFDERAKCLVVGQGVVDANNECDKEEEEKDSSSPSSSSVVTRYRVEDIRKVKYTHIQNTYVHIVLFACVSQCCSTAGSYSLCSFYNRLHQSKPLLFVMMKRKRWWC